MSYSTVDQVPPGPGKDRVLDFVLRDLQARAELGKERYGAYLKTHNGRDALVDAYQEALDLVMYLRQALLERDAPVASCPHGIPLSSLCPHCKDLTAALQHPSKP